MDLESFRKGIVIGLAVAAPVGPIGVLVIQRSMGAAVVGLSTGLGVATADALYALAGALATTVVLRLLSAAWVLELAGGAGLLFLGFRSFRRRANLVAPQRARREELARAFGETLLLTLANPATILSFLAVSASFGIGQAAHAAVFAAGVFVGSAAWWLFLSSSVRFASRWMTSRTFRAVQVASVAILVAFGVLALGKAVHDFRAHGTPAIGLSEFDTSSWTQDTTQTREITSGMSATTGGRES